MAAISQQKLESLYVRKLKNLIELDIDFEGAPVTAILGPNGNGKSTVLHALACAYQPVTNGENLKFSNFFLPNTDALWNESYMEITHTYRDGTTLHSNVRTVYEKTSRWKPIYDRQPKRDLFYIGIDKCVPMIEMEKKQAKINYATSEVAEDVFTIILQKASQILNRRYLKYNIHTASGKNFMGVEIEGLRYSALSMSAGEQKVFHILTTLYNAPKNSLILIDELDLLLHDKAMMALIKVIHARAEEKCLQVVFTTHRETVISLSNLVNIRHLLSTPNKTLCFKNTTPDAINRLTGEQPKPIELFVEDDLSSAIVTKLASQLRGKRLVSVQRFGAASNSFTAVSGLLFSNQNIENTLFVLDGDVYSTQLEKQQRLNKVITGTDDISERYKAKAIGVIKQYRLPQGFKPEPYLHRIICSIGRSDIDEFQEIIDAATEIVVADESHKYINDIIERLGLERKVGLSKIIDLIATTDAWGEYTADIKEWLREKIEPLLEQREYAA
ncbi:TPA: AAA family ATPase [Vibrio cholerae]|uniref:AAA family ATPase n=1 Tax=Vibrio cholerae TaxID=666 RepID=UPI00115D7485|nr:AAA family ATPase [Vibrio cholerae]ELW1717430.1 AAA family ATPase [Vibrio cholerae]TQQ27410.1 AAA family ATPase [Vibrio cholerae]